MPPNASPTTPASIFERDYLREHVTLGYAVTVHSAQGVTTDTAHAVIAEHVHPLDGLRRDVPWPRHQPRLPLHPRRNGVRPRSRDSLKRVGSITRRGTKYSAAHHLRCIAANDDRPRTMHVEAQQTDRELLPDIIGRVLDRHDQRLASRQEAWRQHTAAARDFSAAYERMLGVLPNADRGRHLDGFEL